ncbi:MAG: helix-turn-helix domain-containing protein [Opitutaceae bacterium]
MKSLQREISRIAGVSQSTVSRALRNHPALPGETCERIQAILAWQHLLPDSERVPVHLPDQLDRTDLLKWCRRYRPDACIAVNPQVRDWLESGRHVVPKTIGFALLDWHDNHPGIAGADQGNRLVGAAAADIAVGLLRRNERGMAEHPRITLIKSSWHEGDTVRPRPQPE